MFMFYENGRLHYLLLFSHKYLAMSPVFLSFCLRILVLWSPHQIENFQEISSGLGLKFVGPKRILTEFSFYFCMNQSLQTLLP